jgi:hypothetical protein
MTNSLNTINKVELKITFIETDELKEKDIVTTNEVETTNYSVKFICLKSKTGLKIKITQKISETIYTQVDNNQEYEKHDKLNEANSSSLYSNTSIAFNEPNHIRAINEKDIKEFYLKLRKANKEIMLEKNRDQSEELTRQHIDLHQESIELGHDDYDEYSNINKIEVSSDTLMELMEEISNNGIGYFFEISAKEDLYKAYKEAEFNISEKIKINEKNKDKSKYNAHLARVNISIEDLVTRHKEDMKLNKIYDFDY